MKTKVFTLLFAIVASVGMLNAQLILSWEHNGIYYENIRDTTVQGLPFPGKIVKVSTKYENDSPNGTMGSARMVFGIYSGDIVIPAEFDKSGTHYFVQEIGSCAFQFCDITSISLPNSIKHIGQNAFNGCLLLTSIDIPDKVESIETTAFNRCSSLKNVKIGKDLKTIADDAFHDCYKIKNVTWNAFWCAQVSAFLFPSDLESITFGEDVAFVPDNICSGKTKLENVVMHDNIVTIGTSAFYGCRALMNVHFSESLNEIQDNAFNGTSLCSITIPENVFHIGTGAFNGCCPTVVYWNSSYYDIAWEQAIDFGNCMRQIYFGDKVTIIPLGICRNKTQIEEVLIPASVKYIATEAFKGCTNLRRVSFSANLKKIYNGAFEGCTNLASALVLPDKLDTICSGAFYGCSQIPSITINANMKLIDGNAFYNCTNLKTINNFSNLTIVKNAQTNGYVAYYADVVRNGLDEYGEYLFKTSTGTTYKGILMGYNGNGTSITLPADYKGSTYRIGEQAFAAATQLTSVTIPEAVVEIGKSAFDGCTGFTAMTVPNSVTKIEEKAFNGCSNIATISFGANLTQLGANALTGCTSIQEINCSAVTPPSANANTFTNVPTSATLNIPAGSLNAYQSAQGWSQFTNIVETNLVNTTGVALSATTLNLKKGEEAVLYANVTPSNASYKTVTWSTSNSSVATVTKGIVYGKSAGTATITCTTTNGGYSATCEVTVSTNAIKATGMEFYKYAAKATEVYVPYSPMNEGDTLTFMELGTGFITVNILPYSVTNGNINFTVSDPSVVSAELTEHINFANSIKISPLRPGVAKVTISTTDGSNISKSVYVQITPDPNVKVIGVRCLPREITIGKGEKDTIDALVLPFDATNARVSWAKASGGNPLSINVKTIENKWCEITAKSAGTAYVYVETNDGKYKDTCTITIINKVPVTGLSLNQTSKTLNVGESVQLTPVFTPANATNQKVYWSMDNDTVATIENGLVTAIHEGTVVVTCISDDGDLTATCTITIQEGQQPPITNAITVRLKGSSASGWSKVNLYYWADGIDSPAWPGTSISKDAQGWYGYTFPTSVTSVNIIWNDGNNQTADIMNVTESTCYKLNSTSGKSITVSTISCEEENVSVTGVSLNKKTLQISKGGNYTLAATVLPANATNKAVTWTSSNTSVATISNDGKITAKTAGVSTISCETKDGHFKAECYIVVTDASQGCDYSFEPTAATTIQFEATDLSYSAFEGGTFVILEDASHILYLMYYGSLVNGALPVGNHPVSSIEQNGNIIYSIGGDDSYDYGSFMATDFTAEGYSAAYYIIAGNVSVEDNNSITAKLISVNGSDIIATYRGTQDIEVVSIKDSATKILHNGQILILRGDKTYTLTGQEVR